MSNFVRDEGPLPEGALRALSYINEKANRVEELEAELQEVERERERYREALETIAAADLTLKHVYLLADAALKGERENA